jgi:hypothetical protein
MPNGYIQVGESVGTQAENNFIAAQTVNGGNSTIGGKLRVSNISIGSVAYGSLGTNTTDVAGQLWVTDIFVPYNRTVTKIGVLQGGTATTDNILVALYDSRGNLVANSAVAGAVLSGANTFQEFSLVLNAAGATISSVLLYGPQQYFIAVQGNGTTAGAIRTVAASTFIEIVSTTVSGTFGTVPTSITTPTTFTANNAPIVYLA